MKISIGDLVINDMSVTIDKGIVKIQTYTSQNILDMVKLLDGVTDITYYNDNDEIIGVIEAGYELKYIVETPWYFTYVIGIPYTEKTPIDEINEKMIKIVEPLSIVFVQMAQDGALDDITISEHPEMFPKWDENWTGKAGTILRDGDKLYRSIHDVTNVAQNTKPSETPSMWTLIADPTEEYPEWVQPIGAHDAYALNAKSSHNGKKWVSTVDNNIWEPGVYGWEEVVE